MKKILLIITLCLFGFNGYANSITNNVDTFFNKCKDYETTYSGTIAGICLGYTNGVTDTHIINRLRLKTISIKCIKTITPGSVLDRFFILYQRNQFKIGYEVSDAIAETLFSLCPFITEKQFNKETEELKKSLKSQD